VGRVVNDVDSIDELEGLRKNYILWHQLRLAAKVGTATAETIWPARDIAAGRKTEGRNK
jgi:hypothetical protein